MAPNIGSRRYLVCWETPREGHGGHVEACESHFIEDCFHAHSRVFPSRGLAESFARRKLTDETLLFFGVVGIEVEQYGPDENGWNCWERVGNREEIASPEEIA